MRTEEVILRVARVPDGLKPIPIYTGDPPEPIRCAWLAISRSRGYPRSDDEAFVLYFLGAEGTILEILQYETLDIALDQAHAIARIPQTGWTSHEAPLRLGGQEDAVDVRSFPKEDGDRRANLD